MDYPHFQENEDGTLTPVKLFGSHIAIPIAEAEKLFQRLSGMELKLFHLERICRERANADRKLRPKKEHSGYVLLRSEERLYRTSYGTKRYWCTTIQLPHIVEIPADTIATDLARDLEKIQEKLGFNEIRLAREFGDSIYTEQPDDNIVFYTFLNADFKSGYWSVQIWHTQALKNISEYFLKK